MHNSMRRTQRSLGRSVEYWTWSQSFDGDSALVMSYFFATEEMSNLHRLYLQSSCSLLNINWCIPCVLQARRGRRWTPLRVLHNKHCLAVFFAPHRRAHRSVHRFGTLQTWYWFVIICVKCSHHGCVFEFIKIVWDGQCLHTLLHMGRCCGELNSSGLPFKTGYFSKIMFREVIVLFDILLFWVFVNFVNLYCKENEPISIAKCSIMYSRFCHRVPQDPNLDTISA